MNILEFLNSKDVADYLRKINYRLSPMEQAYLVYYSQNHNFAEKKRAWQEIAEEFPQETYSCKNSVLKEMPLAQALNEYIALMERFVDLCKTQELAVWECQYRITEDDADWSSYFCCEDNVLYFSSYGQCFAYIQDKIGKKSTYGIPEKFRITKTYFNEEKSVTLVFNLKGQFLEAEGVGFGDDAIQSLFWKTCIRIPTPFQRGDTWNTS